MKIAQIRQKVVDKIEFDNDFGGGMTINFLGDSITAGAGISSPQDIYSAIVCKDLGAKENNYGVGGTGFAEKRKPSDNLEYDRNFCIRAKEMDKTADFVFVFGGTNDYGHGDAPIGSLSDEYPKTFCGAVTVLVKYLISVYGKGKLCFLLPTHRYLEDDPCGERGSEFPIAPLSEFIHVEKLILDKFGVDYLDLRNCFPEPQTNTGDDFTVDGLHLNELGHKMIADRIEEYFSKKIKDLKKISEKK